jgi:uncharacterized membrane protein
MEFKNSHSKSSVRVTEMVQIALMTALTYLAASYLNIPSGYGGVIQFGDTIIFVTAVLLGTRQAMISGAMGMTMFDAFSPYAYYAPYTFVIKLVMALIIGFVANAAGTKGRSWVRNILGLVLAGAWQVLGYFGAETFMYKNSMTAAASVPGNVVQGSVCGAVAVLLLIALKKARYFQN